MPLTDLVASKDCSRLPNPQARIGGTGSILETLISKTIEQGGLENDEARRVSWPVLLGVDADSAKLDPSLSWGDLPEHPDEHQVSLDVDRALNYSHLGRRYRLSRGSITHIESRSDR